MPTSCAAKRLYEVASIALPASVRLKNQDSSATMITVTPITHRLCGTIVAPRIEIGVSPDSAGNGWMRLSQTSCARPRRKIDAPMVMMIRVTTSALRAWPTASRSSSRPTTPETATAPRIATGIGAPAATSETALMPPIITNSPWAKLITRLALKMIEKPSATKA